MLPKTHYRTTFLTQYSHLCKCESKVHELKSASNTQRITLTAIWRHRHKDPLTQKFTQALTIRAQRQIRTHTYRYSQFELAAGGTNCLSVGTLPLVHHYLFSLPTVLSLPDSCLLNSSSSLLSLSIACHLCFQCLFHPHSVLFNMSATWSGMAEEFHCMQLPRLGWYVVDSSSLSFIFNTKQWFNWTLQKPTAKQQELTYCLV